jgi:hypothetical protein
MKLLIHYDSLGVIGIKIAFDHNLLFSAVLLCSDCASLFTNTEMAMATRFRLRCPVIGSTAQRIVETSRLTDIRDGAVILSITNHLYLVHLPCCAATL